MIAKEIFKGNLYCYRDMVLTDEQVKFIDDCNQIEWDYVYYNPYVFELEMNKFLVVQFEMTLAEIMQYGQGILKSLATVKDEEFIREMVELVKEKELIVYGQDD